MRLQEVLITRVLVLAAGREDWHSLTYSRVCHPHRLKFQVLWVGGPTLNRPIRMAAGLLEWRLRGPSNLLRNHILMTYLE